MPHICLETGKGRCTLCALEFHLLIRLEKTSQPTVGFPDQVIIIKKKCLGKSLLILMTFLQCIFVWVIFQFLPWITNAVCSFFSKNRVKMFSLVFHVFFCPQNTLYETIEGAKNKGLVVACTEGNPQLLCLFGSCLTAALFMYAWISKRRLLVHVQQYFELLLILAHLCECYNVCLLICYVYVSLGSIPISRRWLIGWMTCYSSPWMQPIGEQRKGCVLIDDHQSDWWRFFNGLVLFNAQLCGLPSTLNPVLPCNQRYQWKQPDKHLEVW